MTDYVLETNGLTKRYHSFTALQPTDLKLPQGEIYGLIGKNGAGKTTLMRMITGQAEPTGGSIALFGARGSGSLNEQRRRLGAMIENPCFFPYLTAAENLEYYRLQRGISGKDRVQTLLKEVDLLSAGNKKFKQFSLGMKQRLGLALTLMADPDLLLLDEPINGLDAMGIVEFRNLLLKLNQERGITILISSHILAELSNLATYYGFIDHGSLIEEVSAEALSERCRRYLELTVDRAAAAAVLLQDHFGDLSMEVMSETKLRLYSHLDDASQISALLVSSGLQLLGMDAQGENLEEYFLELIGGEAIA